jgi:hypothetical protein
MGAAVKVAWVDEEHKTIEWLDDDAKGTVANLATSRWPTLSGTVCLRFVDPWGDTVFNQAQLAVLLAELRVETAEPGNAEYAVHLSRVAQLVERAQEQMHTYIKFIGD